MIAGRADGDRRAVVVSAVAWTRACVRTQEQNEQKRRRDSFVCQRAAPPWLRNLAIFFGKIDPETGPSWWLLAMDMGCNGLYAAIDQLRGPLRHGQWIELNFLLAFLPRCEQCETAATSWISTQRLKATWEGPARRARRRLDRPGLAGLPCTCPVPLPHIRQQRTRRTMRLAGPGMCGRETRIHFLFTEYIFFFVLACACATAEVMHCEYRSCSASRAIRVTTRYIRSTPYSVERPERAT